MDVVDITEIRDNLKSLGPIDKKELILRLFFYEAGFKNCYVARNTKGQIVYLQWLIYPYENVIIKSRFGSRFYPLKEKEVMLENAFTFPRFRGLGLLPSVSAQLLDIARQDGYASCITYIRKDQIVSLNEFTRLGFKITKLVREFKFLGVTRRML